MKANPTELFNGTRVSNTAARIAAGAPETEYEIKLVSFEKKRAESAAADFAAVDISAFSPEFQSAHTKLHAEMITIISARSNYMPTAANLESIVKGKRQFSEALGSFLRAKSEFEIECMKSSYPSLLKK